MTQHNRDVRGTVDETKRGTRGSDALTGGVKVGSSTGTAGEGQRILSAGPFRRP
ncbi:hypothetical protein BN903_59 [Halorubrum sp. AJ67]|nr:hypothetical protein BN903_59 [Halorubrum sp. AJ67]